jgi:hypothetical protein
MKTLVDLGTDSAIKKLKELGIDKVYFKRGVWNEYELISIDSAIGRIKNSSYGADIRTDGKSYYVVCPVDSDMW